MEALVLLFCAGVAGVMALGILVDVARRYVRFRAARHWAVAEGRGLEAYTYHHPQKNMPHFRITYEFTAADGTALVGDTPRLCGDWFWSNQAQEAYVARHMVGEVLDVFYDPSRPTRNCIDRTDITSFQAHCAMAGIFFAFGGLVILAVRQLYGE